MNPNGLTRCSSVAVATHNRATFPVFGAICGCKSATFNPCDGSTANEMASV